MAWIAENWQILFGGVGTAFVAAVLGYYLKNPKPKAESSTQSLNAGNHSTNTQVGRDYKE